MKNVRFTRDLLEDLKSGAVYGTRCRGHVGNVFYPSLYISGDYIHWTNYGSSAASISTKDLAWILCDMFHQTPSEFVAMHERFGSWKDVYTDEKWKE